MAKYSEQYGSLRQEWLGGIPAFVCTARTANGIVPADVTNVDHAGQIVGITTESGPQNDMVMVHLSGLVYFPTPVFGVTRGPVMIGPTGTFVTTLPAGSRFVQQAGIIIGSSELLLNLDSTITLI
ncbi:hypothetical protein SE17_37435 [Kouleothrix aurantiaca]|uniref:Uncharacterized protein n=1 Tax=Kouleothrix aurantiaca TaxID=186479 RepID=A0A0N8PR02_9CHLR|nr:hypothetical protein SE17_37435 [Kouleothrix aurantiaca]